MLTILPQNKSIRRLKIGITGKFASGKSEVLKIFAESGFFVCSADEIAHMLLERGNPVSGEVLNIFGSGILDTGGSVSRQKLGELVFNSESAMRKLENIMHPSIKSEMKKILDAHPLCAAENALLFKMGMRGWFDKIVLVGCSDPQRENNIAERGISPDLAKNISFFQEDAFYPEAVADFIIENSVGLAALRKKTKNLINSLLNE